MSEIIEFPFDSGAYEAADREWLPPNLLATVENMRLDLDGRLGVRPGFTALGTTTYSANAMVAYDLCNYNGRLVALGDQTILGRPTDIFELVQTTPAVWRASAGADSGFETSVRVPQTTDVRLLDGVQDLESAVTDVQCAVGGGFICTVRQRTAAVSIQIQQQSTLQTVGLFDAAGLRATAVYAGTTFWILVIDASNNLQEYHFDPAANKTLAAPTNLGAFAGVSNMNAAPFGTGFALALALGASGSRILTLNGTTGAILQNLAIASGTTNGVGVAGNAAGTLVTILTEQSGSIDARTYNAALVLQNGPTALFGGGGPGSETGSTSCCQRAASVFCVGYTGGVNGGIVKTQTLTQSSHTLTSLKTYGGARCIGRIANTSAGAFLMLQDLQNGTASGSKFTATLYEYSSQFPQCYLQPTLGVLKRGLQLAASSSDDRIYLPLLFKAENTGNGTPYTRGLVYEAHTGSTARRQMSSVANELQIAGGTPLAYDGLQLTEQGFAERPRISALSDTSGGTLTLASAYSIREVWKAFDSRGNVVRSQASDVMTTTLAGANNALTFTASCPHSIRTLLPATGSLVCSVSIEIYRTTAGGANFFLDSTTQIDPAGVWGQGIVLTSTQSDVNIQDNAVLYEQSQTPISHVSPPPYKYSWPARERLFTGGLPVPEQWTFSKLLFPGEPVEFANDGRLGFSGRASQDITAVAAFETVGVVWTSAEVSVIPGRGPEHNGTGEFDTAIRVPSPGGCRDWRSVVDAPPGFFFQMAEDKLMIVPRSAQAAGGAGAVTWVGQPVRQTLALFPVITGAVHVRSQMVVAFSCTNVAGNAGRVLIYDLRREQWYVDTIGPVVAISELNGRLAYILANVVSLQDVAAGTGTFPTCTVVTGMQPVSKRLGWGHLYKAGLLGLDSGACSVEALIDYDDGVGFRSLGIETFTGTGLIVQKFWSLAIQKAARYALKFIMTGTTDSLGLRFNAWALEVEGSKGMVRVGSGGNVA